MKSRPKQAISRRRLAQVGTVTAGFTHDMRNVLAVINESVGLIQDILSLGNIETLKETNKSTIARSLDKASRKIKKGSDICTRMSRFAHTMDRGEDALTVNEVLEQAVFLMQRFAGYQEILLRCNHVEPDIEIQGSAFDAIMALCEGITLLLSCRLEAIVLEARPLPDRVLLHLLCKPPLRADEMAEWEAGLEVKPVQEGFELLMTDAGLTGLQASFP